MHMLPKIRGNWQINEQSTLNKEQSRLIQLRIMRYKTFCENRACELKS